MDIKINLPLLYEIKCIIVSFQTVNDKWLPIENPEAWIEGYICDKYFWNCNKYLQKFKNIKILDVDYNILITDEYIKDLTSLRELNCRQSKITDLGIKNL